MTAALMRELTTAFDAAYKQGMEGLQSGDLDPFADALRKELQAIDKLSGA